MARRGARNNLTPDETLEEFLLVGDAIMARRAVVNGFGYRVSLNFGAPADVGSEFQTEITRPDVEDYRSFWLDFRKLLMPSSPTAFHRVLRAAKECHGDNEAAMRNLESARRAWNSALTAGPIGYSVNGTTLKPREMFDLWVNGIAFHGDVEKRRRWQEITEPAPFMADIIMYNAVSTLVEVAAFVLAKVDYLRGGTGFVSGGVGRVPRERD